MPTQKPSQPPVLSARRLLDRWSELRLAHPTPHPLQQQVEQSKAKIVDLTHDVLPQNIAHGAYTIERSLRYLPPRAIVCAVVDPGVGSLRSAIVIRTQDHVFVGPDNGLLTTALRNTHVHRCYRIENEAYFGEPFSQTFHGRDIFAPV